MTLETALKVEPHLHALVLGKTNCGKTFLMQSKARSYRAAGIGCIVLHKPREPWPAACANWQTSDPVAFLRKFWQCRNVVAFIEMSDAHVGKYDADFYKCATEGRHNGIRCYFSAQRPQQIHPDIRDNCDGLYLFALKGGAVETIAKEEGKPELLKAASLPPRWFFYKANDFTPVRLCTLTDCD